MATYETVLGTALSDTIPSDSIKIPSYKEVVIDGLDGEDTITLGKATTDIKVLAKGGRDVITFEADVDDASSISGGSENDTITFQDNVTNSK